MTALFGRVYRLEVGDDGDTLTVDGFEPARMGRAPAQIRFRVAHNITGYQSIAEIAVFGLGRGTRQRVYEKYDRVRLVAGYQGRHGEIFNGTIYNVSIGRDGPETYVTLLCSSGSRAYEMAYMNRTFGPGTPLKEMIQAAGESMEIAVEFIGNFDDIPATLRNRAFAQTARSMLRQLSMQNEFAWMIENGRLVVMRDRATRDVEHRYSAGTGLIGSPQIHERGLDVRVLMDTTVRPLDRVVVENLTGDLSFGAGHFLRYEDTLGAGEYTAHGVVHSGDFYGDDWSTFIEAFDIRAPFFRRAGYLGD